MGQYRKKPVVIEAVQFTGENAEELRAWSNQTPHVLGPLQVGETKEPSVTRLWVNTKDASVGDWIIKGVAGEFYLCKPDIFEQTYEEVSHGT